MDAIRVERESFKNQSYFLGIEGKIGPFFYYYNTRSFLVSIGFSETTLKILDKHVYSETKEIDGHSVVSAIMISINTSFENKKVLLNDCLSIGYQLTIQDIQLSRLIFYENIPMKYKFIFWFNLDILHEIKRHIIFHIIDILDSEYGLF